ncbi:hypothetical protein D3C71_1665830 [compost metagenome]
MQRAFAQRFHIEHRAQAATDQTLNFLGASALLAAGGLAVAARMRGPRQHAVFSGYPAFALALQERRYFLQYASRAQHVGIAGLHQHRPFGVAREAAFEAERAQLVDGAARGTGDGGGSGHRQAPDMALIRGIVRAGAAGKWRLEYPAAIYPVVNTDPPPTRAPRAPA